MGTQVRLIETLSGAHIVILYLGTPISFRFETLLENYLSCLLTQYRYTPFFHQLPSRP